MLHRPKTPLSIRWAHWSDRDWISEMLTAEFPAEAESLTRDDIGGFLGAANGIGWVASTPTNSRVAIALATFNPRLYQFWPLGFVVDPWFRRQGVGRALVDHVQAMGENEDRRLRFEVNERNLDAQLFLKSLGFWASAPHECNCGCGKILIRFAWRPDDIYRLVEENRAAERCSK